MNMKFIIQKFTRIIAAILLTTSGAQAVDLVHSGKLYVATEGTTPPYSMSVTSGAFPVDGLEVRLMQEVARRLHLTYVPVIMQFDGILLALQQKTVDMSSAVMDITEERAKTFDFLPWIDSGTAVVVHQDQLQPNTPDVRNLVVGALSSSTFAKLATDLGAKEVKLYKSETAALMDLIHHNTQAVITDSLIAEYIIQNSRLPLKVLPQPIALVKKGWAFNKDNKSLKNLVERTLEEMKKDGTYQRIIADVVHPSPIAIR